MRADENLNEWSHKRASQGRLEKYIKSASFGDGLNALANYTAEIMQQQKVREMM